MSVRLRCLALSFGALLGGCGEPSDEAPPLMAASVSLDLEPVLVGDGPQPQIQRVLAGEELLPLLEISAKRTRMTEGPEPAVPAAEGAALAWDPKLVRMELRGPFDPGSFDAIEVRGQAWNDAVLGLHLLRAGEIVRAGTRLAIRGTPEVREWAFEFPGLARETEPLDAIALVFASDRKLQVGLIELALVQRAPLGGLIEAEAAGRPTILGGDGRPAFGLGLGRALEAQVPPNQGARLRLELGLAPGAVPAPGESLGVRVLLRTPGSEAQWNYTFETKEAWSVWTFKTPESAKSGGHLRIEPVGGGNHVAIAVGRVSILPLHSAAKVPLVVLITSDTHRADHVGFAPNAAPVETPALDRLAARGVSFTDCWSAINVTNPSHATLFTGLSPRDTGVVDNTTPLAVQARTLAETFAAAGYDTWAAVSVPHLGAERSGLGQGFTRFSAPEERDRSGEQTVAVLEEWLNERAWRPRFVWLHLFDVHAPYEPPADLRQEPLERDRAVIGAGVPAAQLPGWAKGKDALQLLADYRAEVRGLDRILGSFLERRDVADGIVAFTADHGEALGGHSIWFDHHGLYPGTLAVPLVLAGPGVPKGKVASRGAKHQDLGATLTQLAGIESDLPGENLLGLLTESGEQSARFFLAGHGLAGAVRAGEFMLVLNLKEHPEARGLPPLPRHQVRLFKLSTDPRCTLDLSEQQPKLVRSLRAGLVRWLQSAPEERLAGQREVQAAAELEELRRLGYAAGDDSPASAWFDADCRCEYCAPFAD